MTRITSLHGVAHSCGGKWRHLFSHSRTTGAPLLGHFHHPILTPPKILPPSTPVFQPLTSSSPCLSLDFVPTGFSLFYSHHGLLVLQKETEPYSFLKHPGILICDPISCHTLRLPTSMVTYLFSKLVIVVILSRESDDSVGLRFRAAFVTLEDTMLRAFVASFSDGKCHWDCLLRSQARCSIHKLERSCVRAGGFLFWHICDVGAVLSLDPAALEFRFLLTPDELNMGDKRFRKYRVGEMPDGELCFGSLDHEKLQLWVLGKEQKEDENVWVLEREVCLRQVFEEVPHLPRDPFNRCRCTWLSDMDAGCIGRVFIGTLGYGHYSYHLDTRKLEYLVTDDGEVALTDGHPSNQPCPRILVSCNVGL